MGKKNTKKKTKKIKKLTPEKEFVSLIRHRFVDNICGNLDKVYSKVALVNLEHYINIFKEMYNSLYDDYDDLIKEPYTYLGFLDYFAEGLFVYKNLNHNSRDSLSYIRDKVLDYINQKNLTLELAIISAKINIYVTSGDKLLDTAASLCKVKSINKHDLKLLMSIINCTAVYCSLYATKIKNYRIKGIVRKDEKLEFLYDKSRPWLYEESLDILRNQYLRKNIHITIDKEHDTKESVLAKIQSATKNKTNTENKVMNVGLLIIMHLDSVLSSFSNNPIYADFLDIVPETCIHYYTANNNINNFPLKEKGEYIISLDEIVEGIQNRKYSFPKSGVWFKILDDNSDIEHMELIEDNYRIFVNCFIKNEERIHYNDTSSNFYFGTEEEKEYDSRVYENPVFKSSLILDKSVLKQGRLINSLSYISNSIEENTYDILYLSLICVYLAYYNPKLFENTIQLSNIEKCESGGYKRARGYRTAYIRKLPKNYTPSKEALARAKEEEMVVPKGYTFVSASNMDLEDEAKPKVIKL